MTNRYFISSRQGRIKSISIHKYNFSTDLDKQKDQKNKFCNWLRRNPDILLYDLKESCFFTYLPMDEKKTWQYNFDSIDSIEPPFDNTSLISNYLGQLLRNLYNRHFEQYLNQNTFVIDNLELSPFHLLKCFQYNIEVFPDGEFYIHFLPVSKIVSSTDITNTYLLNLKNGNENNSHTDSMVFSMVECKYFRRRKFDLLDKHCIEKAHKFMENRKRIIATFDYHFVANYSPKIFGKITENTIKELAPSIDFLAPISDLIELPDFIELHDKPFYEVSIDHLANRNNLLIGSDKKVKEQKAAFYNGIYQPVNDKVIQPVAVDGVSTNLFKELIEKFNQGGSIQILDTIELSSSDRIDASIFKDLKKQYKGKLLLAILTKYQQPRDYFEPVYKVGVKLQMYQGQIDQFKLSNYAVKCLEKLGGFLNVIDNTFEPETTYFVGIDLGHTTHKKEKYSNLCVVLFDNKGRLLAHKVIQGIPRNEALDMSALAQAMYSFEDVVKKRGLPYPQKLIIHRDGKVHDQDIESFDMVIKKGLKIDNYDLVEIIKSGYPVIAAHNGQGYRNIETGNSWTLADKRYAILVTNIQAKEQGAVLSPIVIKHKQGETDFSELVEQVYWFTKVYTNNLYNSTRLPATTEKANNLVGTSDKRFVSTYTA